MNIGEWIWGSSEGKKHFAEELTDENFDAYMKDNPVTGILFYAPWCFYSQQVMPAWDLAAQKLQIHDPPVRMAKIDTHRYGSTGEKYGVTAYPTLKLFVDGAIFEYGSEGRSWQQIVKWVNTHIDRDHVLTSGDQVDHYLHDNALNVVGLFADGHNSTTFVHAARHFDDVIFAEARGTDVAKDIAVHLARHAGLVCETIDVGQGTSKTKTVQLPRDGMLCGDTPGNPQRPEWTDRFAAAVKGKEMTITRTDTDDGWQQLLQFKCCDAEDPSKTDKYNIPIPSVVMFMPHDERFAIYDGDIEDIHALDRWISARRTPMVMTLTMDTAEKILDTGPEKIPVVFYISKDRQDDIEKELREAAKSLRGRALVCFSGLHNQIEMRLANLAGVEEDSPAVVTLIEVHAGTGQYHTAKKYRIPTQGLKASAVIDFVSAYEKGSLKPWMKSEPEPSAEEKRSEVIGVLVGSTFVATTQDHSKDVLVDFYAPWCGHCRKFEPLYKSLAKKVKHVKSLKILKFDATRNEIEGMQISGFPTVILFPGGASPKRQHLYQGNRQPEDILRWLHEYCTNKFDETPPKVELVANDEPESGLLDPSEDDL